MQNIFSAKMKDLYSNEAQWKVVDDGTEDTIMRQQNEHDGDGDDSAPDEDEEVGGRGGRGGMEDDEDYVEEEAQPRREEAIGRFEEEEAEGLEAEEETSAVYVGGKVLSIFNGMLCVAGRFFLRENMNGMIILSVKKNLHDCCAVLIFVLFVSVDLLLLLLHRWGVLRGHWGVE